MSSYKTTFAIATLLAFSQVSYAAPGGLGSNDTPDILIGGLAIETGTHSGSVSNGSITVHAENAKSYNSGHCLFKANFLVYNDSPIEAEPFYTKMTYNNRVGNNAYTELPNTNIKNFDSLILLKPGKNTINVHADYKNQVEESNESNNRLTKQVNVIGKCNPATNKLAAQASVDNVSKQNRIVVIRLIALVYVQRRNVRK